MLEALKEMLGRDPFVPFQIVMSSGDRFRIEEASLAALSTDQLAYYLPRSNSIVHIRMSQIVVLMVEQPGT